MGFNYRRFIDLLFYPLYDLRSKVTIYIRNREVKTGFRRDPSTKHFILISVVLSGVALSFLLFWILIRSIPSAEKTENTLTKLPAENQQELPKQDITVATAIETDKEIPKIINPFPVVKNENQDVEVNEKAEAKTDAEIKEEKKEDEVAVVAAAAKTSHYMKIVANNVNIRTKPSLESDIIARLGQGFIVKKLDSQGDWVLADAGGDLKGWIYHELTEDTTADAHESWKKNANRSAVIGITREDLDDPNNLETEKKKIEELLDAWKTAWEEKDIDKYMSFYSKAFTKATYNWESYKEYKKTIFIRPGKISVEIKILKISWGNFFMIASFVQKYESAPINSTTLKMLHFQQEIDGWKIVKESLINQNT
tara:strand:- start:11752 stop:12852 length:1101 start_codon:yes stop_codon:yes gene_type:complete